MNKLLVALLAGFVSVGSYAYEVDNACLQYVRQDGSYSNTYRVQAMTFDGDELNDAIDCWNCYTSWSKYIVIPWDVGQYSTFEIQGYQSIDNFILWNNITDSHGRTYRIKEDDGFCF